MTADFHKHRRIYAVGILLAFLVAWVVPVQAGIVAAAHATSATRCPDCPMPCCTSGSCETMAAACSASMVPAVTTITHSPQKAIPAIALQLEFASTIYPVRAALAPPEPSPRFVPPNSVNIRFCTFQI